MLFCKEISPRSCSLLFARYQICLANFFHCNKGMKLKYFKPQNSNNFVPSSVKVLSLTAFIISAFLIKLYPSLYTFKYSHGDTVDVFSQEK
jgi:hypothetical protein